MIRACGAANFEEMWAIINDGAEGVSRRYWKVPERQIATSVVLRGVGAVE